MTSPYPHFINHNSIQSIFSWVTGFVLNGHLSTHSSVNFKKNEKAYDSTNSEVFKMLQEAQNDPPEPGNLIVVREQEEEPANQIDNNPNVDQQEHEQEHYQSPPHPQPPPPVTQNHNINNHNNYCRNEETFQTYLTLATMLKYLNNGSAFAENHLED